MLRQCNLPPYGSWFRDLQLHMLPRLASNDGGHTCTEIDHCQFSPCHNGATCINLACDTEPCTSMGYMCECVAGFVSNGTSQNCDTELNECASSPCQHGGLCHETNGYQWIELVDSNTIHADPALSDFYSPYYEVLGDSQITESSNTANTAWIISMHLRARVGGLQLRRGRAGMLVDAVSKWRHMSR